MERKIKTLEERVSYLQSELIKRDQNKLRGEKFASAMLSQNKRDFWKEVKRVTAN